MQLLTLGTIARVLVLLAASGQALALDADKMNEHGIGYVVADVTKPPPPGAVDRAPPPSGTSPGMAMTEGVTASSGGAHFGAAVGAGLLVDLLLAPKTYDSRMRLYRVIYDKGCVDRGTFSFIDQTDVSILVPGQPAHWIPPPVGKKAPVMAAMLDERKKPLPLIDAAHPCYQQWKEAVAKYAKPPESPMPSQNSN